MGKYSLDAISSCGFGVDAGSLGKKEDSEFAKNVKKVFDLTLSRVFMFFFTFRFISLDIGEQILE